MKVLFEQVWAVLENRMGNVRRARELFDAATVADKKHVAAWHGWAILELKQGNIQKARSLLSKGLQYCGQNEYIYQTLALLEAKANRYQQARYLFNQATKCNPKSCASWLVSHRHPSNIVSEPNFNICYFLCYVCYLIKSCIFFYE
jgi:predicted Zn-dependent protease